MADIYTINPKIVMKIKSLDEREDFKKLLLDLLEFEKMQTKLGELDYAKQYDRLISDYITKHQ